MAVVGMETAVNEFLKTGIFPLPPNVFPNCTFEPEEAPAITQQDKLNSQNILLHRNLLELLACKTKYLVELLACKIKYLLELLTCKTKYLLELVACKTKYLLELVVAKPIISWNLWLARSSISNCHC